MEPCWDTRLGLHWGPSLSGCHPSARRFVGKCKMKSSVYSLSLVAKGEGSVSFDLRKKTIGIGFVKKILQCKASAKPGLEWVCNRRFAAENLWPCFQSHSEKSWTLTGSTRPGMMALGQQWQLSRDFSQDSSVTLEQWILYNWQTCPRKTPGL